MGLGFVLGVCFNCVTIYGSDLLILLAYAPSMPPLLSLPLFMRRLKGCSSESKNSSSSSYSRTRSAEETETNSSIWDDGSEDVNPFGRGNTLLTKERESEPIIWDI
nr:hypothetical protein [Tanacetum cinerariifolium]